MKHFITIIFLLVTTLTFSQKKGDINSYTKAEIKEELKKIKAEYPKMLQMIEIQYTINQENNKPKRYGNNEEIIANRFHNADNCKLIYLSKNNDSISFYGKTVTLEKIDKNHVIIKLPNTLLSKTEKIQAENKNGQFIDHFFKKSIDDLETKRIQIFKDFAKQAFAILDDFDQLSESEIKKKLKKEEEKLKKSPKRHLNNTQKVYLYFNGNVENIILYISDLEIPKFQSETANAFVKKYSKYIDDYIDASSNNNIAKIDRVSRMTPQITREANEIIKEISGFELQKFNEFMAKKSEELQKYFDSKK